MLPLFWALLFLYSLLWLSVLSLPSAGPSFFWALSPPPTRPSPPVPSPHPPARPARAQQVVPYSEGRNSRSEAFVFSHGVYLYLSLTCYPSSGPFFSCIPCCGSLFCPFPLRAPFSQLVGVYLYLSSVGRLVGRSVGGSVGRTVGRSVGRAARKGKGQNREPQQGIQEKKGPEKGEHKQFHAKSVDICDMLAKGIRVSFVGNSGEFGYFSGNSAVSAFCRT